MNELERNNKFSEKPLKEVIREEEFLEVLQTPGNPFFKLLNSIKAISPKKWHKGHMFRLYLGTNEFESLLDDFGARKNKTFCYFGELVAALRWLGITCYTMEHVEARLLNYSLDEEHVSSLFPEFRVAMNTLKDTTLKIIDAVLEEAGKIGLHLPEGRLPDEEFLRIKAERFLPENLGEKETGQEEDHVSEIAAKYLAVTNMIKAAIPFPGKRLSTTEELTRFISRFLREEQIRVYEVSIHNLQSRYDTYLKNTPMENELPYLRKLRGYISVALHLLECGTYLVHLDERHEDTRRDNDIRQSIARLVNRPQVLSLVVDFFVRKAVDLLVMGKKYAESIIEEFTKEEELELAIPDGVYLHARPASLIVSVVNHHGLPIEVEIDGEKANASSIMSLMILAGRKASTRKIKFKGDRKVLKDLEMLFECCFGEEEKGGFPPELSYLKHPGPNI